MEKINFINGQAPALNGANLNQMQTNIENAIASKHELNCMVATTLVAQTISSNYIVTLDTIAQTSGSKLTLENGCIKIGEGVSKVRVSGAFFIDGWAGGDAYLWGKIYKNNIEASTMINTGTGYFLSCSMSATIIDVAEGDYIKLMADGGSGGTIRTGGANTFLCVEVIE